MVAVGDPARRGAGRPFVGRDREVADLVAGLEDAIAGRMRLLLIAGEPGIGKTWLAEHLAGHAAARGAQVVWVRCWEAGGAPPFWPWTQLLRVLAEDLDDQALAAAGTIGMAGVVAEVQSLRVGGQVAPPEAAASTFRREGEYWTVAYDGTVVRLKDTKGLRHLARLLAHPGREFHAVDLEAADGRPAGPRALAGDGELAARPDLGDAGTMLDATAKAAYRARLAELRAEIEEAEGGNDPARAAKARDELDFLVAELARAVGLGGRDRRAASHAERARLNATRAIRAAMANLARANPALGAHLSSTIRTGRYCSYTPDPRAPITWAPERNC